MIKRMGVRNNEQKIKYMKMTPRQVKNTYISTTEQYMVFKFTKLTASVLGVSSR